MNRLLWCLLALFAFGTADAELLSHGRFENVAIYKPAGEVRQVILFLSGDQGWDASVGIMASVLANDGALVAGIDLPRFRAALLKQDDPGTQPVGDLENLSHFVQAYFQLPTYLTPILVGYEAGATLAHATAARAAAGLFAGALSVGPGTGVELSDHSHTSKVGWMPQLRGGIARLTGGKSERLPPPPASLSDLPIVEVPANAIASDLFVVFLSGDGGWAGLDQNVAKALAVRGIPVAGLDSLRYFWKKRTPESLAVDLDRAIRYYATHWQRSRVLLIGYSQGADVLPFALNRLPVVARGLVSYTALIGISRSAMFEFHLTNWISNGRGGLDVLPEMKKLSSNDTMCIYGADDKESICPELSTSQTRVMQLPGGHHFDGNYDHVAEMILTQANQRQAR